MPRKANGSATMRDVARAAGVSVKTVSNVVNGYQYLRPETRARVEAAIAELGFHVNVSAQNLSRGRTNVIALVVPSLRTVYFAELADAVVREASDRGLTVFVVQTSDDRDRELRVLDGSYRSRFDGIIYSPLALGMEDLPLFEVDFPLVLLGERVFGSAVDHVTMANVEGSRAATEHVLDLGAVDVVPLGMKDDPSPSSGTLRFRGFQEALRARGLDVDPRALIGVPDYFLPTGMAVMEQILDRGVKPDAVVAFTDSLAIGALATLRERGLRVPEDVLLVGFDNIEGAAYAMPPLSTIDPGRKLIARHAVTLLEERIRLMREGVGRADQPAPRQVVAEFELLRRGSTAR